MQIEEEDSDLKVIEIHENYLTVKLIEAKTKSKSKISRFRETNIDEIKKTVQNLSLKEVI